MKNHELKLANSVIFLPLLFLVFFMCLQGCNQGDPKPKKASQPQPMQRPLSYRYCTDRDLIDLPKENEKLIANILDEPDGWFIYRHIYIYPMNFYYDLPKAAKKMNEGFQISLNCYEMFDCKMKDGVIDDRETNKKLLNTCNEGLKIVRNYFSKLWGYRNSHHISTYIKEQCADEIYAEFRGEGSSRRGIEEVLTNGIPMLPTIEDTQKRMAFKKDLAKLCTIYKETNYCKRNLPEIPELCATIAE